MQKRVGAGGPTHCAPPHKVAAAYCRKYVVVMRSAAVLSLFLLVAAPARAQWANACGDGRVDRIIDNFDDLSAWSYCCSDNNMSPASFSPVAGCSGQALRISYNLASEWLVVL